MPKTDVAPARVRVTRMRAITRKDPMLIPRAGLLAAIEFDVATCRSVRHVAFHVSRLEGEQSWAVDACFEGSMPLWSNGIGARYVATRPIADPTLLAALAAAEAKMTAQVTA